MFSSMYGLETADLVRWYHFSISDSRFEKIGFNRVGQFVPEISKNR